MSDPTIFTFENHKVRIVLIDGEPWFVAVDVCKALNLVNSRDSLRSLDDDEKGVGLTDTLGGKQNLSIISESGMYTLVLRCRDAVKPGTLPHRFRKWVTSDVLPTIRKTGKFDAEKYVDVQALLLSGGSKPTLPLTDDLNQALENKSFEMALESFRLSKQYLIRAIAYRCEYGAPRQLSSELASDIIAKATLGNALAHHYYEEIESCASYLQMVRESATEAIKSLEGKMTAT